jgi:hypothetical protein
MWSSYVCYHPRVGYTMMPSIQWRVPAQRQRSGYLAATNAAGFRADFEYDKVRTPGKFRATLFGDSQTAGDDVSNGSRYSDILMRLVDDLQVYNYGLSGTGPDQQYLIYLDCARVETDLVIIGLHIDNIRRVNIRHCVFRNSQNKEVIYAKPYYTLNDGELVLHHVPVPRALRSREDMSPEEMPYVLLRTPKYARLRKLAKALGLRPVYNTIVKHSPAPEYDKPDNPAWQLLRAILKNWIEGCEVPVLLFLVPIWQFVEGNSDPSNYQARFAELARETGCYLHDPLADLREYSIAERRGFRFPGDDHFTPAGHNALAVSLATAVRRIMADRECSRPRADAQSSAQTRAAVADGTI